MTNAGIPQQHGLDALADLHSVCRGGPAYFRAGGTCWKDLRRIELPGRVENALHIGHHGKIVIIEDEPHELLLLDTNAVFAAERTARVHAYTG